MNDSKKRKRGRPRVDARLDQWGDVQDRRERKRIQDRLAQRARRDRILTQVCGTSKSPITSVEKTEMCTTSTSAKSQHAAPVSIVRPYGKDTDEGFQHRLTWPDSPENIAEYSEFVDRSIYHLKVEQISQDHSLLSWPAWPIFSALRQHGQMQNILAGRCDEQARSALPTTSLPEGLRPTPLQLVIVHRRLIDRFPFPRLRDNMILLQHLINLDEFVRDLFDMVGLVFRSESGKATWDPSSWKLGSEFSYKWGYLFN